MITETWEVALCTARVFFFFFYANTVIMRILWKLSRVLETFRVVSSEPRVVFPIKGHASGPFRPLGQESGGCTKKVGKSYVSPSCLCATVPLATVLSSYRPVSFLWQQLSFGCSGHFDQDHSLLGPVSPPEGCLEPMAFTPTRSSPRCGDSQ